MILHEGDIAPESETWSDSEVMARSVELIAAAKYGGADTITNAASATFDDAPDVVHLVRLLGSVALLAAKTMTEEELAHFGTWIATHPDLEPPH